MLMCALSEPICTRKMLLKNPAAVYTGSCMHVLARQLHMHVLEAGCTHDAAAPCRVLLDTVRRSRMS